MQDLPACLPMHSSLPNTCAEYICFVMRNSSGLSNAAAIAQGTSYYYYWFIINVCHHRPSCLPALTQMLPACRADKLALPEDR